MRISDSIRSFPKSQAPAIRLQSQLSKATRFAILSRDGFRCRYCGRTAAETVLHVDHRWPRARGGDDQHTNLVTACVDCNLGKRDAPIAYETHPFPSSRFDQVWEPAAAEQMIRFIQAEFLDQTTTRLCRLPSTPAQRTLLDTCWAHWEQANGLLRRLLRREAIGTHEAVEAWGERFSDLQEAVQQYEFPEVGV